MLPSNRRQKRLGGSPVFLKYRKTRNSLWKCFTCVCIFYFFLPLGPSVHLSGQHTDSQPCPPFPLRGWGEGRTMTWGLCPSPRLTGQASLDSPGLLLTPSFFLEPSVLPFPTQPNSSSSPGLSISTVFSTKSYLLFQSTSSFFAVCPWKTVGTSPPTPPGPQHSCH